MLEKLLDTLMRTAIAQAGAQRGLLILSRDQAHWAEALEQFPKAAALVMPVGMKQILEKLADLAPLGEPDTNGPEE